MVKRRSEIKLKVGGSKDVPMHVPEEGSFLGVNYERPCGWNITHLPTGLRAYPKSFETKDEALTALAALQPLNKAWGNSDKKTAHDECLPIMLKDAADLGHEFVQLTE